MLFKLVISLGCLFAWRIALAAAADGVAPEPLRDWAGEWARMRQVTPRHYICYRASGAITIDGRPDEASWASAPWTEDFADIEGDRRPRPRFRTRAKMLWDERNLYIFAELQEPHVWGTLTKKNDIMFQDNDFEVFINPEANNHNYYEYEMNALNTIWELTLDKPYRDDGPAHLGTNLPGLRSAVHVNGTINNPVDTDRSWCVEIAIPFADLARYARGRACPPHDGDQWRANFSRVEWLVDIIDGQYRKIPREMRPEDNWVWSPQGVIDMHRPERWGYVQFSNAEPGRATFRPDPTLPGRDALMDVYYRERGYHDRVGRYTDDLAKLDITSSASPAAVSQAIHLQLTSGGYVASTNVALPDGSNRVLHVREDSKLWEDEAGPRPR